MSLGLLFWILMLLCLVVRGFGFREGAPGWVVPAGGLMEFLLFLCLGWKVFGAAIHG